MYRTQFFVCKPLFDACAIVCKWCLRDTLSPSSASLPFRFPRVWVLHSFSPANALRVWYAAELSTCQCHTRRCTLFVCLKSGRVLNSMSLWVWWNGLAGDISYHTVFATQYSTNSTGHCAVCCIPSIHIQPKILPFVLSAPLCEYVFVHFIAILSLYVSMARNMRIAGRQRESIFLRI